MSVSNPHDPSALARWLQAHTRITVLTGAGISTASGIPDYRDANGDWKRKAPITHDVFIGSLSVRKRYWARSLAGWTFFASTQPNAAHRALAAMQAAGMVGTIITQNVDRLHQKAGSHDVVDLHGRLDRVICLDCATRYTRDWLQQTLQTMNPDWTRTSTAIAPDGDADIDEADFDSFKVPDCPRCGGMLKPDVVFHGGAMPRARRERAEAIVTGGDGLLVVGSSLMIGSAYRLLRLAVAADIPVVAVNQGRTRADDLLAFKLVGDCAVWLQAAYAMLKHG